MLVVAQLGRTLLNARDAQPPTPCCHSASHCGYSAFRNVLSAKIYEIGNSKFTKQRCPPARSLSCELQRGYLKVPAAVPFCRSRSVRRYADNGQYYGGTPQSGTSGRKPYLTPFFIAAAAVLTSPSRHGALMWGTGLR